MTCLFERKDAKNNREANSRLYDVLQSLFMPIREEDICHLSTSILAAFSTKEWPNIEVYPAGEYLSRFLVPSLDAIDRVEQTEDDLVIFGRDNSNFCLFSQGRYIYRLDSNRNAPLRERLVPFFAKETIRKA